MQARADKQGAHRVSRLRRARGYLRRARTAVAAMRRYAVRGQAAGLMNGLRTLGALAAEIARRHAPRAGDRICPICGWSGPRFGPEYVYDAYEADVRCYACGSAARCRLFKRFIGEVLSDFFAAERRRVLDVGPELYSRSFFPADVRYASFDLSAAIAGVRGDLTRLPFAASSCDFWLCSHVLDVIPDDRAAMAELLRVLRPGGVGLLDNAMRWNEATQDFAAARQGEYGRLRRYGRDLVERLAGVGFEVEVVDPTRLFDAEARHRYGLSSQPFLLCRHPAPKPR